VSRIPRIKELTNTRLTSGYGGWIYCEGCSKTIGYLCYVTYESFKLEYNCKCGSCGSIYLSFSDENSSINSQDHLIKIKNRLCCPVEQSPLVSIIANNLDYFKYEVVCKACNSKFMEEQTL
jgi:hypothetical protein